MAEQRPVDPNVLFCPSFLLRTKANIANQILGKILLRTERVGKKLSEWLSTNKPNTVNDWFSGKNGQTLFVL